MVYMDNTLQAPTETSPIPSNIGELPGINTNIGGKALPKNESELAQTAESIKTGSTPSATKVNNPTATPVSNSTQPHSSSTQSTVSSASFAPQIADDDDLIEKEWVQKAKIIVESTKKDPHEQNNQMTAYKTDYQNKRFKGNIKINETK